MAFKIELEKYENYRRLFRAKSAKTHVSPSLQELILRTNEFINSDHCQEWQVSVIIWFFRFIRKKNSDSLTKYYSALLSSLEEVTQVNRLSVFNENVEETINSYLLCFLEQIRKDSPFAAPALINCLDDDDKYLIESALLRLKETDGFDDIEDKIKKSEQIKILESFKHHSGFSKYLHQLEVLLEKSKSNEEDYLEALSAIKYLLKDDDILPDNEGLMGLVDDLYAISKTFSDLSSNEEFYQLVNSHEEKYPAFSLPGVGELDSFVSLTNLEDLLKASYTKLESREPLKRFIVTTEIGPLGLLIAISSSISDRFDASSNLSQNERISFIPGEKICLGRIPATYFGKESHKQIIVEYCGQNEKKGIKYYDVKDRQGKILTVKRSEIVNGFKVDSSLKPSSKKAIEIWLNPENSHKELFLWSKLLFCNEINKFESKGKILLISSKKNLKPFREEKIFGEELESWFGIQGFNSRYELEEEKPSPNQLFPSSQIILANKDDQAYKAIEWHRDEAKDFNLSLIVCSESSFLEDDTFRSRLFNTEVDTLLLSEVYKNNLNKKLEKSNFRPLIGVQDQYEPIDATKKGPFGSYLIRTLKPNIIVHEMKDDSGLEHLDKIKSFRKQFHSEDSVFRAQFAGMCHSLGQRLIPLEEDEANNFEKRFNKFVLELELRQREKDGYTDALSYLQENKEGILNLSRIDHIESYLKGKESEKFFLVCRTAQKEKIESHFKKSNKNVSVVSISDLEILGSVDNILIPFFMGPESSTKLRNYRFAEKHIFFLTKEEYKVHKKMEKRERKFFSHSSDSEDISFELSESLDEQINDLDPLFSLRRDTVNFLSEKYKGNTKENIPSHLFLLSEEKIYLSPENGEILSISRESEKIIFGKSNKVSAGDHLIISEGISGNDLLHARLEEDEEIYTLYKEIEQNAKLWQIHLKNYKEKESLDFKELKIKLDTVGVTRDINTIKSWLSDPETIRPKGINDVNKIFDLVQASREELVRCKEAIVQVKSLRAAAKNELNEKLEKIEVKNNQDLLEFAIGSKIFNFAIHKVEGIEKIEVDRKNLKYKIENIEDLF